MSTTIYGTYLSPFVRKVIVFASIKKIEYNMGVVLPSFSKKAPSQNAPEDWADLSPLNKIPALRDEDVAVSDSSVICDYLERKYPQKALIPADPVLRARCKWYEEYADTTIAAGMVFKVFGQLVIQQYVTKRPVDKQKVEEGLTQDIPNICDYLERELEGKEYLVDNQLSLADISVAVMIVNLNLSGHSIDAKRWKNIGSFHERMSAIPEMATIVSKEMKIVKDMQQQA